jgi:ribosomal protein L12E/L44/L45/RPP1/RPP2
MSVIFNAKKPQQKGTGFLNLQKVVGANNASRLGGAVGGGITQQANQARAGVNQAQNTFQQESAAKRLDTDANKQKVQEALADPTKAVGNQEFLNQFTKLRTGTYEGPTALQNADKLRSQSTAAEGLGQATRSQGGQIGLLQRFATQPTKQYARGQQRLDSMILNQAAPQLQEARKTTIGLGKETQRAESGAQQTGQEILSKARQFGDDTTKQLQDTTTQASGVVDARVKAAQEEETRRQQLFEQARQSGDSRQMLRILQNAGATIDPNQINQYSDLLNKVTINQPHVRSNLDFNSLVRNAAQIQAAQNLNRGSIASEEERKRLNAFSQLGGQAQEFTEQTYGPYQAGRVNVDLNPVVQQLQAEAARLEPINRAIERDRIIKHYRDLGAVKVVGYDDRRQQDITRPMTDQEIAEAYVDSGADRGFYCYAEGTKIKMSDGSFKPIEELQIGDNTFLGGKIKSINSAVPSQFYFYKDTIVTGKKAVLVNGIFQKIEDIVPEEVYENTLELRVIAVVNDNHVLVTETHIGTDVSYSDIVIDNLNENKEFLAVLQQQAQIMFGEN